MITETDNVKILADNLNASTGDRLTTFLLKRFPKCLLAELNTHRMLSRNAASSRAIPVKRMVERIKEDPYIPIFRSNQPGMQGGEDLDETAQKRAYSIWNISMSAAIFQAERLAESGIHKDMANRILEPYMRVPVIVSGTEWSNFFKLRCSPMANPDFELIACEMRLCRDNHVPQVVHPGEWHSPFYAFDIRRSAACCARISYTNHETDKADLEKDLSLHDKLWKDGHWSPFEHQAQATDKKAWANYVGFRQYRSFLEQGEEI